MGDTTQGLYNKFRVQRVDGSKEKEMGLPEGCDFEPTTAAEAYLQQEMRKILCEPPKYGKLKDCPFCGNSWGSPQIEQMKNGGRFFVSCMNPQCGGSSGFTDTKEEAVAIWNMRANAN